GEEESANLPRVRIAGDLRGDQRAAAGRDRGVARDRPGQPRVVVQERVRPLATARRGDPLSEEIVRAVPSVDPAEEVFPGPASQTGAPLIEWRRVVVELRVEPAP